MTNPVLGNDELPGAGPAQPEIFVNDADRKVANALGGQITIDFAADANYSLALDTGAPENDEWPYSTIEMTDTGVVLTAGRDVEYPDVDTAYGGPSRLLLVLQNSTAQTLTIKRSGQTGVPVAAGDRALVRHNGIDIETLINPI